jgi:hypothetical protein
MITYIIWVSLAEGHQKWCHRKLNGMTSSDGSVIVRTRPTIDIEKINGESVSPQTSPYAVEREQVGFQVLEIKTCDCSLEEHMKRESSTSGYCVQCVRRFSFLIVPGQVERKTKVCCNRYFYLQPTFGSPAWPDLTPSQSARSTDSKGPGMGKAHFLAFKPLQDDIWRVESLNTASAATPSMATRDFFSRMSMNGASPATQREARITGTDLQEEEEATLVGFGKRVTKVQPLATPAAASPHISWL